MTRYQYCKENLLD